MRPRGRGFRWDPTQALQWHRPAGGARHPSRRSGLAEHRARYRSQDWPSTLPVCNWVSLKRANVFRNANGGYEFQFLPCASLHRSATSRPADSLPSQSSQNRVQAAAVSIERRITCRTSAFDRNRSWLMMPQPASEASITRTPSCSMTAFSAAPTRLTPPAICPDSASARSFVAAMTVILRGERADAVDRRREHVHVDVRRGEHHGPDSVRNGVTMTRVKLAQAFQRQHGSHAVCDDVDAAAARGRHNGLEHAFERIAGPHRAIAVIGVVEQSRLGRPGEYHRLALEPDAIGEVRGIERRCLERLFEAVHVDQDVASAAGLREKIADLSRHRLNAIKTPIGKPGCGEEKRLSSGGTSFARATVILEARSGPNQGFVRPPFTGLRVVVTSNVGPDESGEASKRAPVAPTLAHPPSAIAPAEDTSPRRNSRRDAMAPYCRKRWTITQKPSGTVPAVESAAARKLPQS